MRSEKGYNFLYYLVNWSNHKIVLPQISITKRCECNDKPQHATIRSLDPRSEIFALWKFSPWGNQVWKAPSKDSLCILISIWSNTKNILSLYSNIYYVPQIQLGDCKSGRCNCLKLYVYLFKFLFLVDEMTSHFFV